MFRLCIGLIAAFFLLAFSVVKKPDFRPPGTVEVSDSLFFDQTEITTFNWLEYTTWMKNNYGDDSPEYLASLPDSSVFTGFNEPFSRLYFFHPAYHNYPVVGVSYNQAQQFCTWRSERVKEMLAIQHAKKKNYKMPELAYRLPSEAEWELVANAPLNEKSVRKSKSSFTSEDMPYNVKDFNIQTSSEARITSPATQGVKNSFGMQNLFGNVAEMIAEEGVSKGGSFFHTSAESQSEKAIAYESPTHWLGFRCVCIVKE